MRAMLLTRTSLLDEAGKDTGRDKGNTGVHGTTIAGPLVFKDLPVPQPGPEDILIKVSACGICHTELDQIEGRIVPPKMPVVPGHQVAGVVAQTGKNVTKFKKGDMAGATWFFSSCGKCRFCINGQENLCDEFKATGCHADGGYAEYMVISETSACMIPLSFKDLCSAAPLMCAGVVGWRSVKLAGMENGKTLGLYGFGSANHIVLQTANWLYPDSKKFVLTRNPEERKLAIRLGADWAGDIEDATPQKLDCIIDTTPVWKPVIFALGNLQKGGRLVMNLIRKEEKDKQYLQGLDYAKHLWLEKEVKSVANVTSRDAEEFLDIAAKAKIRPHIRIFSLEEANAALYELKSGKFAGSKVLHIN